MARLRLISKLRSHLRALRKARNGNITVTFALATLPIVGFVGAAVDYSQANSARTAMQAAIDSTALMLSKNASTLTPSQMQTNATNYFLSMFNRPEVKNIKVTPTYTKSDGSQVVIVGTAQVPTNFMGIMGFSMLNISATSTVKWGNTRLRVALALDNTGSMADAGKMTALQTATKNLLTQLKNAATQNGDVYVSIVPFSKDVNVGASNYNSSWVDFTDHGSWAGWDSTNGSCSKKDSKNKTITLKSDCEAKSVGGKWTSANHNTWNGCVTDRDQDYDTTNTSPSTSVKATLFPAEQYSSCPVAMMGLTYDWTSLTAKVNAMSPNGNTNQTIGLQWAFQSLTSSPFTIPAKDPNYKYTDVVILLTDGLNTENRFSTSQSSIDARTKKACDNIKAAGLVIYAIQVNTGGDPTQAVLQQCASSSDKFFLLTSANQVVTTFNSIGTALSQLRIAK